MATQKTRSNLLLAVLDKLRGEAEISHNQLVELAGSDDDARRLTELLLEIGFMKKIGDKFIASHVVHMKPDMECIQGVCGYVVGDDEVNDFHKLMDALKQGNVGVIESDLGVKKKDDVDPEVLKRYVKEYIEVEQDDGNTGGEV